MKLYSLIFILLQVIIINLTYARKACTEKDKYCIKNKSFSKFSCTNFELGSASDYVFSGKGRFNYTNEGIQLSIDKLDQYPSFTSKQYIFYGRVDAVVKYARGIGIVSYVMLISDIDDEIDWEWLGGSDNSVESNFYRKGDITSYARANRHIISLNTLSNFHTYTIDWTKQEIKFSIDNELVRVIPSSHPEGFPQTPTRIKFGMWVGGSPKNSEGTIMWAGGLTDFDDIPFTMTVKSINITNYNPASSYNYNSNDGNEASVVINN